ncbi:MAG: T9SS type A sorting domain-containing protein [Bacteroidales bacterium]|nr:T9SS type A sorting domain-containing protein [Bacteroidales bacterium]
MLAVFLLLSASAGGQAERSVKYQLNGNLQENNVRFLNNSVIINYSAPEINIENISNEAGTFYRVAIPGHMPTVKPGRPELPVYSKLITIPDGTDYFIKISEVRSTRIKPSGKKISGLLYPAQESEAKTSPGNQKRFVFDKSAYETKGIIASDTVSIEKIGTVRNRNLANLIISPVRYNPKSNVLEVITSMKIEILFTLSEVSFSKSMISESSSSVESLSESVMAADPGEVVPGFTDKPVKMIILTDTAFKKHIKPFVEWKTQKGFRVQVLYKGTGLAGNTYTQLRDTLTKIYNAATESDPAADYLLIIGDINRIPYYGTGQITDMYYAEYDGNGDYIPEMHVGRLPVADTTELKSILGKIIQYEKFQFVPTNKFYYGAIAAAGSDAGYATYMNGQLKYLVTNYLAAQTSIKESHFYYPSALDTEKDSIIKLINKGTSFINYTGHGVENEWLHLKFKVADTALLKNKDMYPLIISNACRTGAFGTKYSLGNRMVLSENKGAIGFIGCSNDSYWDEDYYWSVGTIGTISADPTYAGTGLGAFDRLFHTHSESPSNWYYTLGQINYAGNLSVSASTSARKKYYWETYNVIGDPSLIPIIGQPKSFTFTIPDTLPNGIKSMTFNIEPFAYIAVSRAGVLWDASYASASGSAVLEMPGLSNDSCLIVVTGQNRYPIIKTVRFSTVNKEFLNLTSTSINDVLGNNNLRADYSETFYLKLTVGNLGLTDATGVYAKISSASEWLTINTDSAYIGTLLANSQIVLSDKLKITVKGNVPDLSAATIRIMLKDNKTEKQYSTEISIHSPDLQIISCIMDDKTIGDGDYIADPGETFNLIFRVKNQGSSDISGQFSISSLMSEITILEPSKNSGVLKYGQITDIPVLVKLAETVPSGYNVSVNSTLDCTPFLIKKDFAFRVGRIRESFEASSFTIFPWINISQIPWTISSTSSADGIISAKSGAISHNSTTSLIIKTVYTTADSLKFYYKVSSETNYDYLSFSLNDKEIFKRSGEVPWTKRVVAVPAGLNKMEWKYKKDQSVSGGTDCAYLDMIDFAVNGYVSYIQKDLHVAKLSEPVEKEKFGMETISVKVLNEGKDILNSFNLAYSINGKQPVLQTFNNQLIPNGDTVTVSFTVPADMKKYGIYNISVYGYDNKDDYLKNDTIKLKIENTKLNETLSVFPNPIANEFTIYINSQLAEKLRISLTNVSGRKLHDFEKSVVVGKNTILFPDIHLAPAVYYLNIRGAVINKTIPVLKIK